MRNKKRIYLSPHTREEVDFFYDNLEESKQDEFRRIVKLQFFGAFEDKLVSFHHEEFTRELNVCLIHKFEKIIKDITIDGKIHKANLILARENNC